MANKQQEANRLIILTLKEKITQLENLFNYFNLSEANFSKSLINDLNAMSPKIKTSEKHFTAIERTNLIFINEIENNRVQSIVSNEQIAMLLKILKRMNLELQNQEERLNTDIMAQQINFDKKAFSPVFGDLFKKCKGELNRLESKIHKADLYKEELNKRIDKCEEIKGDINQLFQENCELNRKKEDLKYELKKYSSLPTDVNQIKTLIEIKKEELKALGNRNKY